MYNNYSYSKSIMGVRVCESERILKRWRKEGDAFLNAFLLWMKRGFIILILSQKCSRVSGNTHTPIP